jgi:hypothetical protein
MMKMMIAGMTLSLALLSVHGAAAQQPADPRAEGVRAEVEEIIERSGITESLDSLAVAAAPELERALGQLSETLNALTHRIANDPALRASALRVAQGMVGVAHVVLIEQTRVLEEVLGVAADRLEEARSSGGR